MTFRARSIYVVPFAIALLSLAGCDDDSPGDAKVCNAVGNVCTVMGTGEDAFLGEGKPPSEVALSEPIDLAFDKDGRLLVLDWENQRLRRLDSDGKVRTIMGNGEEGPVEEGAAANASTLHHTFSIDVDNPGNVYLAGNHFSAIYRIDTSGIVHLIAGGVDEGFGGDGENAHDHAIFMEPAGVAVDPEGHPIYIADTGNNRIREIGHSGTIETIAGDGTTSLNVATVTATSTGLHDPYRVRFDKSTGTILVIDTAHNLVRRVDGSGMMSTVAGTGEGGFSGDNGSATSAKLSEPSDATVGADGLVYIADTGNSRIRRVGSDGKITTIAGTGAADFGGDQGPATSAAFNHPSALRFGPDGNLYVADTGNNRIRVIRLAD